MRGSSSVVVFGLGLCAFAACAGEARGHVEAVFCAVPSEPTSAIPMSAGGGTFGAFRRPYRSPDGRTWIMTAYDQSGFFGDTLLLIGDNLDVTFALRSDDAAPWAPGETVDTIDEQCGINDSGQYAFSVNTSGGPTETDEYVLRYTPGATGIEVMAQEGGAFPGIPGAAWGVILDETHILNDGRVAIRSINTTGLPSSENTLLALDGQVRAQEGVTVPIGQGGGMETWETFDFYSYQSDATGNVWMAKGNMSGSTSFDHVATVNDFIVVREGFFLTGSSDPITTTPSHQLGRNTVTSAGDWFFRGTNSNGGEDWLLRNGQYYYQSGDEIVAGSGEHVGSTNNGDAFFLHTGDNAPNTVVGIYTDHSDDDLDEAIVLNKAEVIMRSGDAIDMDRNGLFDDDAFIADFPWDEGFLTDDGSFYVNVNVRDAAGTDLGEAFVHVALPLCLEGDVNRDGVVNFDDLNVILTNWGRTVLRYTRGDGTGDGSVDFDDLNAVLTEWEAACI